MDIDPLLLLELLESGLEPSSKPDLEALRKKIFEAKPTSELLESINNIIDNNPKLLAPEIKIAPGKQVEVLSTDVNSLFRPEKMIKSEPNYIMRKLHKSPFFSEDSDIYRRMKEDIRSIISKDNNNQAVFFRDELNPRNANYGRYLDDSADHINAYVKLTKSQQTYRIVKAAGWTAVCFGAAVKEYARAQTYKLYNFPISTVPKDIYTFVAGSTLSYYFGEFILNNFSTAPVRYMGWGFKYIGGVIYYLPASVIDHLILGPIEKKVANLSLPVNITKENGLTELKSTGADAHRLKKVFDHLYSLIIDSKKKN